MRYERTVASVVLLVVVLLQFLNAVQTGILKSNGSFGRFSYFVAFTITVIHDVFVGFGFPASMLFVAYYLHASDREIEILTLPILGALWYGPGRVLQSFFNILHLKYRLEILLVALGSYHRSIKENIKLLASLRKKIKINKPGNNCTDREIKYYRRKYSSQPFEENFLRSVARIGVSMAISGEFSEISLREWYMLLVADQACYPESPLKFVTPYYLDTSKWTGFGCMKMIKKMEEIKLNWDELDKRKLSTVAEGIRTSGLKYLKDNNWVD